MIYETRWLGTVEYSEAEKTQADCIQYAKDSGHGTVLGLEHKEVITLGLRGKDSDILFNTDIPIYKASRGGQATYHNPGQLVIYPVCPIKTWNLGARNWVETLTEITRKTLEECNIIVINTTNGLFTKSGKIASLGFNLKGGVSSHGIAINVSNELDGFSKISACGVRNQPMDRVADTYFITPERVFSLWCAHFDDVFLTMKDASLTYQALQI